MKRTALKRRTWLNRKSRLRPVSRTNSRRRRYRAHLASPFWKALKARVFARDNGLCRECGEPATDAAHLTYVRFGHERDEDVAANCSRCNQAERVRRILG